MSTFQSTPEDQKEWDVIVSKIKELEVKLRKYPQYKGLDIIKDNTKGFKSQSEQNKYYNSLYSALEQDLFLLEERK